MGFVPFYRDLWKKHGDIVSFRVLGFRVVLASHPDHVRHVIVERQDQFVKGRSYDVIRLFVGNGLLTSSGQEWIAQRRMMKGEFTVESVNEMRDVMVSAIQKSFKSLDEACVRNADVDIFDEMRKLALNVVSTTLFGRDFSYFDEVNEAISEILEITANRALVPFGSNIHLPTPSNFRFKRALKRVYAIVDQFTEVSPKKTAEREPLIVRLIAEAEKKFSGQELKNFLRDQITTLFLAGHETTALTLSWAWCLLAKNPDMRAKLDAEIDFIKEEAPNVEELRSLKFVHHVAMETLRLYPPVWVFVRDTVTDAELSGHLIKAKTRIVMPSLLVHRHPDHWENPDDFDPTRFERIDSAKLSKIYFPFSMGPRKCIGDHFALMELALAVTMLAKRYHFTLEGSLPEVEGVVTLRAKAKVKLKVQRR